MVLKIRGKQHGMLFYFNIFFVFFIFVVSIIPPSLHWHLQDEYNHILLQITRIIFASILSFMIAFFLNSYFMSTMKLKK